MARGETMVVKKMVEAWELSNNDKKTIKENAQKLKNYFVLRNCDNCEEFYNWCDSDYDFLHYIKRILPFIEKEKDYITNDDIQDLIHEINSVIENVKTSITINDFDEEDDVIEFISEKYNDDKFLKKLLYDDKEFINELLNK